MTPGTKRQDDRAAALFDEKRFSGEAISVEEGARRHECPYCHKLQFKGVLASGSVIETKCSNRACRRFLRIRAM